MTDGIIKGTGNSRYLKSVANALALYPTHESLMEALAAGTLPIDLNGINPAGWNPVGDKLDKATLLTDALCTALGLPTTATPTQAMEKLRQLATGKISISTGTYVGTGTESRTIYLPAPAKAVILTTKDGRMYYKGSEPYLYGGIAFPNNPIELDSLYENISNRVVASISGSSLNVRYFYSDFYHVHIASNVYSNTYYYICFY